MPDLLFGVIDSSMYTVHYYHHNSLPKGQSVLKDKIQPYEIYMHPHFTVQFNTDRELVM